MLVIFTSLFILILLYLILEYYILNRVLNNISIRILVNGTRGKTTTVKILYNIFLKSGVNVFAKTTGDLPIEYYSDGQQKEINRFAPASIIENVRLLHKWAKFKPEAIILECMALHPENQFMLSQKMFKPSHIIVTNIFSDHLEVMGKNIDTITKTISESFNNNAQMLIAEHLLPLISSDNSLQPYPDLYIETSYDNLPTAVINENWSLISKVCELFELDTDIAAIEFHKVWQKKDEDIKIVNTNLNYTLWNLFSINDYDSAKRFIEYILDIHASRTNIDIVLNTRSDRPLRTQYFVSLLSEYFKENEIYVTGTGKSLAFRLLKKTDCTNIHTTNINRLITMFNEGFAEYTTVLGLGNNKGLDKFSTTIRSKNNSENQ